MTDFLHLQALKTAVENLTVIPSGPIPPNPAELLGSTRMRDILDALGAEADVIIIDTPPALVVTDSVVLADASDGVLLVASATKSTRRDLKRLMAMYDAAEVPVLGAVLNRAAVFAWPGRGLRVVLRSAPSRARPRRPPEPASGGPTDVDLRDPKPPWAERKPKSSSL